MHVLYRPHLNGVALQKEEEEEEELDKQVQIVTDLADISVSVGFLTFCNSEEELHKRLVADLHQLRLTSAQERRTLPLRFS